MKSRLAGPLVVLAAIGSLAAPTAAQAGTNQCANGQACVWKNKDYLDLFRGMTSTANDYRTITWNDGSYDLNDEVSAVRSQGNSCRLKFFADRNQGGHWIYFNAVKEGFNYQDPYLANGGGTGTYSTEGWNDRISSHQFVDCTL